MGVINCNDTSHAPFVRNVVGVVLAGAVGLLLTGCPTLFDSPPGTQDVHQEAALNTMNKLLSTTPEGAMQEAMGKANAAATDAAQQHTADAVAKARSGIPASGDKPEEDVAVGWKRPELTFQERVVTVDMPQLAVWGLDSATLLLDGERIELGKMTREGRIALIGTGQHRLQVKCPLDPPFSADFYLRKGDRIVLRGRCSSDGRAVAGEEKKRN